MALCLLDSFEDSSLSRAAEDRFIGIFNAGRTGGPNTAVKRAISSSNPGLRSLRRYYLDSTKQDDVLMVGAAWSATPDPVDLFVFGGDYVLGTPTGNNPATKHVTVKWSGSATGFTVWRGSSGSGTLLGTYLPNVIGGWTYVEARVKLHDTFGEVQLRLDEIQVMNLGGVDTKNGGTASVMNSVDLVLSEATGYQNIVDDLYISNEQGTVNNSFLGSIRVEVLRPNGNGSFSQWVGTDGNSTDNYLLVADETAGIGTLDTSNRIASGTVGTKDYHQYENSQFSASRPVKGVIMYSVADKDDSNARSFRMVAKEAGGVEAESADQTLLNNVFTTYSKVWDTQPTGAAWNVSAVNNAQFGVKTT